MDHLPSYALGANKRQWRLAFMYNMSMNDQQISQLEIVKAKVVSCWAATPGHADDHVGVSGVAGRVFR